MSRFFDSSLVGGIAGASLSTEGLEKSGGVFTPSPLEQGFRNLLSNSVFSQDKIFDDRPVFEKPLPTPPRVTTDDATGNPFKGTHLEKSFENLQALGLDPKEWALAGSASLWVLSQAGAKQGLEPLITRLPNDIDILVVGESAKKIAQMGTIKESQIAGFQVELHPEYDSTQSIDFTTHWPTMKAVDSAKDLSEVAVNLDGINVMKPQAALGLKSRFVRDKDHADLAQAEKALTTSWQKPAAPVAAVFAEKAKPATVRAKPPAAMKM